MSLLINGSFPSQIQVVIGGVLAGTDGFVLDQVVILNKVPGSSVAGFQEIYTEDGTLVAGAGNRIQYIVYGSQDASTKGYMSARCKLRANTTATHFNIVFQCYGSPNESASPYNYDFRDICNSYVGFNLGSVYWGSQAPHTGSAVFGSGVDTAFKSVEAYTSAPDWEGVTPELTNILANSTDINVQINENGTAYSVVLSNNATPPNSQEVKNGTGSGGSPAVDSDSVSLVGSVLDTMTLTGLSHGEYDVYVVAEDTIPNLQASPIKLDLTIDSQAPNWENGTPSLSNVVTDGADVDVQISEAGKAYLVVVPNDSGEPSPTEIKAGQAAGGGSPIQSAYLDLTASTPDNFTLTGLSAENFDVYLVAEDTVPNLQTTVSRLDLDLNILPVFALTYPKLDNIGETTANVLLKINEEGDGYAVAITKDDPAPSISQIKNGQDSTGTPVPSGNSGTVVLNQDVEKTIILTNLDADTSYDIYVVAEDEFSPTSDSPVKLHLLRIEPETNPPREESDKEKDTAQNKQVFVKYISQNRPDGEIVFVGDSDMLYKYVKLLIDNVGYNILYLHKQRPGFTSTGLSTPRWASKTSTAVLIRKDHWDEINNNYNSNKIFDRSLTWFLNYAKLSLNSLVSSGKVYLIKKSEFKKQNIVEGESNIDVSAAEVVLLSQELYDSFFV